MTKKSNYAACNMNDERRDKKIRAQRIEHLLKHRKVIKAKSIKDGTPVLDYLKKGELSCAVWTNDNSISRVLSGSVGLTEKRAKKMAEVFNAGIKENDADQRIRWQWLFDMKDEYMTEGEYNAAIGHAAIAAADSFNNAADQILFDVMSQLDFAAGKWQLEDMETGLIVPYTETQQNKLGQALRDYAAALLSHHVITARKNQIELEAAESRGDAETAAIYRKKLEEDI